MDAGHGDPDWICSKEKPHYDQMFQSLNPIDGKVTGAGNYLALGGRRDICRFTHNYPHLRGSLTYDRSLEILLKSTVNCNLLTELCLSLKKDGGEADARFDKIVDALAITAQSCHLITKFVTKDDDGQLVRRGSEAGMSSGVSIHSLNDSLPIESAGSRTSSPKSKRELEESFDDSDDDEECDPENKKLKAWPAYKKPSFSDRLFTLVKILFLIVTNAVMIVVIANLVFVAVVYYMTGKHYLEFRVDRASGNWLYHARSLAFGSEKEILRVETLLDFFKRQTLWRILRQFFDDLESYLDRV